MVAETLDTVPAALAGPGFAFVAGAALRERLGASGRLTDWEAFAASWNDLRVDPYMADGGRYRRRRHAVYAASPAGIVRGPHQAHYQTLEYNRLHGGIARWFEPIEPAIGAGPTLGAILETSRSLFEAVSAARQWHVEAHQFRIEGRAAVHGRPTPEGVHRDGVDYVIVLLVDRVNVTSGTTSVHALDGRELGSFTLTSPLDAALLDDRRVAHGVTEIAPLDPSRPSHRDVLVVTWKALDAALG